MRDDRAEARLLLAVVRGRWEEVDAICEGGSPDPAVFLDLSRACDVQPWIHARLERAGRLSILGARVADGLTEARRKCRSDNLLLLAGLERALDVLREAGVEPVVLKGAAILHQFDLSFDERRLDDVDLLVAAGEFDVSLDALRSAGWTPPPGEEPRRWLGDSFEQSLRSPGPVPVLFDVHSHIAQRPRYRVEIGEVLDRAVPVEVSGRRARRLEDHDQAAHLLLHHLQHYFDRRMKWAIDFRMITGGTGFDWRRLGDRLREWEGTAAAAMSLRHIHKLIPEAVPDEGLDAVPVAAWRRLLTWPLTSSHPLDLFRGTRSRSTQIYLGAVLVENPAQLGTALARRFRRESVR